MLIGIPQKRVHVYRQTQLYPIPPSIFGVFDYLDSSGGCAACPASVVCVVFAVSGRWR